MAGNRRLPRVGGRLIRALEQLEQHAFPRTQNQAVTDQRCTVPDHNGLKIQATPGSVRLILSGLTAVFLLAHAVTQVGIYSFGADKHWLDALNMDRELNLPTLFSSGLMLGIAVLLQRLQTTGKESPADWRLLSRIFVFLALDEALQIHELLIFPGLRHQIHPALASTWVIPYGVLVLVLLWRFRTFLRTLPSAFASRALQAGMVYIGGTIGMEMVGSFAVRSDLIRLHSFWYGAITGLEETLELLGLILFIHALMQELINRQALGLLHISVVPDHKKTAPHEAADE